jgi:hypothetical protein
VEPVFSELCSSPLGLTTAPVTQMLDAAAPSVETSNAGEENKASD